jgi:thimet oligopeptidase
MANATFQVMLGIPLLEGTSPASCFPRIAIGYDAVCYSYIWRHNASVIFGNLR